MAPVQLPNYNKWVKPPTTVYEDNYGYGINFYQPMIDYITAKEQGASVAPPHLPWNNERGLEKYRHDKPIKSYSSEDLSRISKEVAEQAKRDLNKFEIAKRSPFSVVATACAANINKHVGTETVISKARKKKIQRDRQIVEIRQKEMDNIDKEIRNYEIEAGISSDLKQCAQILRGKSARAIAQTLLTQSQRKVDEGKLEDMRRSVHQGMQSSIQLRNQMRSHESQQFQSEETHHTSYATTARHVHVSTDISDSLFQPLSDLREDLKRFHAENSNFLVNKSKGIIFNVSHILV